jgi:RNA polymerase sigma-70 factor (ECF subfamily)
MPGWHLPTRSRPFLAHDSLRRLAGAWCWRPVSAARRNRPPHLAALCENYWYPLYAFVRRRGHEADEAQDFTQALFAAAFGKERSRRCPSRAWKVSVVPADVAEALPGVGPRTGGETGRRPICPANRLWAEPSHDLTPEKIFERRGALVLLECFAFWTVAFHLMGSSL